MKPLNVGEIDIDTGDQKIPNVNFSPDVNLNAGIPNRGTANTPNVNIETEISNPKTNLPEPNIKSSAPYLKDKTRHRKFIADIPDTNLREDIPNLKANIPKIEADDWDVNLKAVGTPDSNLKVGTPDGNLKVGTPGVNLKADAPDANLKTSFPNANLDLEGPRIIAERDKEEEAPILDKKLPDIST